MLLNVFSQFLKEGAGGSATTGTRTDLGSKAADVQGLENLLSDENLFRSVSTRLRRQGDPDGISDTLLQQNGKGGSTDHHSPGSHSSFCKTQV